VKSLPECSVTCHSGCRNVKNSGPKVWRYLCEDCAQEQLEKHRKETGHKDLNLKVASEVTMNDLRRKIRRAEQVLMK
jgi:hypothetical protein